MSQRIFYEIDGRVHGPINLTKLQLMAASGMLLPQHRVKREGTEVWFPAQNVRGLFSDPSPGPPTPVPVGTLVPQSAQSESPPAAEEEIPFGGFGAVESEGTAENAFDFFSDQPVAAPPAPPPKQTKAAKAQAKAREQAPVVKAPEPQPFELVESDAPGTVADSNIQAVQNPFEFSELTPATLSSPPSTDLPEVQAADDEPTPPAKAEEPKGPSKQMDSKSDSKQPVKTGAPGNAAAGAAEVVGRAVEFLTDGSLHLLDGKTILRLHRSWLLALTRFADGTTHSAYMRLQRIDAGIIEQRPNTSRGKAGPHSLLTFIAGETRIGLVFQGNEKIYRTFLERVLLLGNVGTTPSRPAGKA